MLKEISAKELRMNPMTKIGEEWMLVTAGDRDRGYNTMTASWGHLGSIWCGGTSVVYVRPQRYTKQFVDREPLYTICFFPPEYREKLAYLGSHSGRDGDKVAAVGLTPVFGEGYTYFQEASLVMVCRKVYQAPIKEEYFVDRELMEKVYAKRDFHDMYVGEIVKVLADQA